MRELIMAVAALVVMAGQAAAATPGDPCGGGQVAEIRIDTLKSPQAGPLFEKAARDQALWYRAHGLRSDRFLVGPVLDHNAATNAWTADPTKAMTIHLKPPGPDQTRSMRDKGWDAFVAEYRASSDVASETIGCAEEPVK